MISIVWWHQCHVSRVMELFSKMRWSFVSAQMSNKFDFRPLWTFLLLFWHFVNTTACHLGRCEPSSKELHNMILRIIYFRLSSQIICILNEAKLWSNHWLRLTLLRKGQVSLCSWPPVWPIIIWCLAKHKLWTGLITRFTIWMCPTALRPAVQCYCLLIIHPALMKSVQTEFLLNLKSSKTRYFENFYSPVY